MAGEARAVTAEGSSEGCRKDRCRDTLTAGEAAALLGVHRATVYRWLASGKLTSLGRADVEAVAAKRGKRAAPRGRPFARGYDPRRSLVRCCGRFRG